MDNTILGKPPTFGDVKQIEWLRKQALNNADRNLPKINIECKMCYGSGRVDCEDCDGNGTFTERECPHCKKHSGYGIAEYNKDGDIICGYCNHLLTLNL